jgi:amino acid transporter
MLGYVVKGTGTLSAGWYRTLGVGALAIAVFFLVLGARKKWSDFGDRLLNSWMYPIWWVIYFGLYIISFLKGYVTVMQANQPDWIQYSVFFIGYAAMLYIAVMAYVKWPKSVRK